jgi:hypothetical protein
VVVSQFGVDLFLILDAERLTLHHRAIRLQSAPPNDWRGEGRLAEAPAYQLKLSTVPLKTNLSPILK